jgi:nucleotide-binding universal stress UspA family protein
LADLTPSSLRKILVATDLQPRCDRAIDRAVQLSQQFGAELLAAHVMSPADTPQFYLDRGRRSWRRIPDPVQRMRWRLKRDLAAASESIRPIVETGEPADRLVAIAEREDCDLIVTGAAGPQSLGIALFGSTVNRIVRGSRAPVLMVHDRPAGPYRNILIATDFSEASRQALETVGRLFPQSQLTLFHGYDIPYAGFIVDRDIAGELRAIEQEITARFLSDPRIAPELKDRTTVVIEHGTPEAVLDDYVEDHGIDLTVIGSKGRGAVFDALVGSTAKRLVEALEGDLLIIRHVEGEA